MSEASKSRPWAGGGIRPPHPDRILALNDHPHGDGHVLYWMTSARRTTWNPALDHAIDQAQRRAKPLVVLEALRLGYPYASDRLHHAVLSGMRDNAAAFEAAGITYLPYVEEEEGQGKGLLATLAQDACLVVADAAPIPFLRRMVAAAARHVPVRMQAVDGWGILPLARGRAHPSALALRRVVQRDLPGHLEHLATPQPLQQHALRTGTSPAAPRAWPLAHDRLRTLATDDLPVRHDVAPVRSRLHGPAAANTRVEAFLRHLDRYDSERNHPDRQATSTLSPDLHFGHVGAQGVLARLLAQEGWDPGRLAPKATGKREGWWGASPGAEAFLDQLVVWRELGALEAWHNPLHDQYDGLPAWARATLEQHAGDPRPRRTLAELRAARSGDEVWDAAQRELLRDGLIHNYLRMLWGKRFLEWAPTPRQAFAWMLELNDTYALDGRDPNSVCGIAWVMGRYDHPWPEREAFGSVRCMTSKSTRSKLEMEQYLGKA